MRRFIFVLLFVLTGCISNLSFTSSTPTPASTPTPPLEITNLPVMMHVKDNWVIWELPGLPPLDSNSDFTGWTGQRLGVTTAGEVEILEYAWSDTDKEFYVYIKQNDIEGWVPFEALAIRK